MPIGDKFSYLENPFENERLHRGGFVLCTAGRGLVRVNGKEFNLAPGWAFIVTPLIRDYKLWGTAEFEIISFVNELSDYQQITDLIADTGLLLMFFDNTCWKLSIDTFHIVIDSENRIRENLRQIADGNSDAIPLLERRTKLMRQETLLAVYVDYMRTFSQLIHTSQNNRLVYRFIIDLSENVMNSRAVSWYADRAGMSTGHFSALIRKTTGHSPGEWINLFTVNIAKEYLENSGKSVKEIASALNFPDQSTFGKFFNRNTGISPSDYRKAHSIPDE